jgi:hypothetical protein
MSQVIVNERSIEFASPFVRDVAELISKGLRIDADKDGKISLTEGLVLGQSVIVALMKHYSDVLQAVEDLKDADAIERKELIKVFSEGFDLDDDTIESLIERTIAFVEDTITNATGLVKEWAAAVA